MLRGSLSALLFFGLFLPGILHTNAHALQTGKGGYLVDACSRPAQDQIAKLLQGTVADLKVESAQPAAGHLQCTYKVVKHLIGGSDGVSAELAMDFYHFGTPAEAQRELASVGSKGVLQVKTDDAPGTIAVVKLPESVRTENVNSEPGWAVRRNENMILMQMSGNFMQERPAGWSYAMQALGLDAAGATVRGPLFTDVCSLVPAGQIQTLLTLQPATLTPSPQSIGSTTECEWTVKSEASAEGRADLKVTHERSGQDLAELASDAQLSSIVQTTDPADKVYVPSGTRGEARAIHGSTVADIKLSDPDAYAIVDPSFAYRVQRAALLAAGATVVPTTRFGPDPTPKAIQPPGPPTLLQRFSNLFSVETLPILIPVVVFGALFFGFVRRSLLRSRLTRDGVPGKARVVGVGETGTTINNDPVVRFDVMLSSTSGTEYAASVRQRVTRLIAPASLIGKTYPVLIDRSNPQTFIFTGPLQ